MKSINQFFFAFFLLAPGVFFAQKKECNHAINFSDRITVDDDKVEIMNDLPANGSHRYFNVSLKTDNTEVRPRTYISGTGTNIPAEANKKITWYYKRDGYNRQQISALRFQVMALDPLEDCSKKSSATAQKRGIPPWAGLGTVGLTGLTLVTTGAIVTSNASGNDDYKMYKENTDPNDPVWETLGYESRDDLYKQVNKDYKKGQWIMAAGGAVIAVGGAILVSRMISNSRGGGDRISVYPYVEPVILSSPTSGAVAAGVGMKLKF
ncbi:MAG: hypothetical protein AAB316_14280 [Bacteroidota bacterium]